MHEYGLCRQLLSQVIAIAVQYPNQRVAKIHVQLGPLAGVSPDELSLAFPLVSHDTLAAPAQLSIELMPLRARCTACGHEGHIEAMTLCCQECGSERLDIISGNEILLKSIEFIAPAVAMSATGSHGD